MDEAETRRRLIDERLRAGRLGPRRPLAGHTGAGHRPHRGRHAADRRGRQRHTPATSSPTTPCCCTAARPPWSRPRRPRVTPTSAASRRCSTRRTSSGRKAARCPFVFYTNGHDIPLLGERLLPAGEGLRLPHPRRARVDGPAAGDARAALRRADRHRHRRPRLPDRRPSARSSKASRPASGSSCW